MNQLPKSVREIAEVIGIASTMKLLGQLPTTENGGHKNVLILYVPKRLPADHKLVQMIGWHPALKLVHAFGGEILYPANCRQLFKRMRDDLIRLMVETGAKTEVVADLFGMTPRNVRNIASAEKTPEDGKPEGADDHQVSTEGSES